MEHGLNRPNKRQEFISLAARFYAETRAQYDCFMQGAEFADLHPSWINVKDELPPYQERVLVFCKGSTEPQICERGQEYGKTVYYNDEGCVINEEVCLWMPLPKVPGVIDGQRPF